MNIYVFIRFPHYLSIKSCHHKLFVWLMSRKLLIIKVYNFLFGLFIIESISREHNM